MLRALAWKEWREQRALVVAGVVLALTMPVLVVAASTAAATPLTMRRLADVVPVIFAVLLWPMIAFAAGSATFANESGQRTLGFLASRPVSFRSIWLAKVSLAGC